MEITYDYYRIFYYVAKYKSFSKAANVLGSNQPNITKFMNNLESQLRCKLFVRSNRGTVLTPEGEKLYTHVAVAYVGEFSCTLSRHPPLHFQYLHVSSAPTVTEWRLGFCGCDDPHKYSAAFQ